MKYLFVLAIICATVVSHSQSNTATKQVKKSKPATTQARANFDKCQRQNARRLRFKQTPIKCQ